MGTASFPNWTQPGVEHLSILDKESGAIAPGEVIVKSYTLDAWADEYLQPGQVIDILALDLEGYDAKVLFGAARLFTQGRVRLLEFEVHTVSEWEKMRLKDVLDYLGNLGFICYYAGQSLLWRISGSCWTDEYEQDDVKWWSNVVCAPVS